jgi:hypothetical protein
MADVGGQSTFTRYEMVGVIIPGASLLLGLWWLFPGSVHGLEWKDISLGGLGIFVVASFCAGHVLQAPANIVMDAVWRFTGRPTERMRSRGVGLADSQVAKIPPQVESVLGLTVKEDADESQWRGVVAQIAGTVASQGRDARMESFNGNYGLFRGLTSALIVLCVAALIEHRCTFGAAAAVGAICTAFRMQRFSRYYAREMWVQFLMITPQRPES